MAIYKRIKLLFRGVNFLSAPSKSLTPTSKEVVSQFYTEEQKTQWKREALRLFYESLSSKKGLLSALVDRGSVKFNNDTLSNVEQRQTLDLNELLNQLNKKYLDRLASEIPDKNSSEKKGYDLANFARIQKLFLETYTFSKDEFNQMGLVPIILYDAIIYSATFKSIHATSLPMEAEEPILKIAKAERDEVEAELHIIFKQEMLTHWAEVKKIIEKRQITVNQEISPCFYLLAVSSILLIASLFIVILATGGLLAVPTGLLISAFIATGLGTMSVSGAAAYHFFSSASSQEPELLQDFIEAQTIVAPVTL